MTKRWAPSSKAMVLLCLVAAVAVTILTADSRARAADILTVGVQLEPPNLDPTQGAAAAIDEVVYANVFEGLTGVGPDGSVIPRLAARWEISEDGRRFRFFLHQGVFFHNGAAFDAEDVKFSLERAGADGSVNAQKSLFEPIESISIIDRHTVDIVLDHPVGGFLLHLAWGDAVIVDAASAPTNASRPVGTGPFRFSRWRKGVGVDLVRNENYWGAAPALDGVRFKIIPDPTAAFAALMSGDVDGFPAYPAPENLEQFRRHNRFDVIAGTSEGEAILAINNKAPPFDDLRVRRALSHAVDKQAIIDGALFGYGAPIGSHFPPHHPSYIDLNDRYPFDVERAKALLAEAGYPDGFETTLKLPPPSYARRSGEIIAAQLSAVGVRVRIENLEWAQWLDQVFANKNYELSIVAHTEPLDIDIYAREGYYFQYQNPDFNRIIAELGRAVDPSRRDQLFKQAQQKLSDDAVNVFLFIGPKTAVWAKGVSGVWANAPLQANDFTGVARTGLSTSAAGRGGGGLARVVAFLICAAGVSVVGFFAYRAGVVFVVRRLVSLALTMAAATIAIFMLVEIAPGDPAAYMMGLNAEPEALEALREELGLGAPAPVRYLSWVGGLVRGDFGTSYTYRTDVFELIAERLQVSAPLALYSILLAIGMAVPTGMFAARRRGRGADSVVLAGTQAGIAMPNFWIAILLVLVFASGLRWFPVGGFPGWDAGLFAGLHALTLPALALAIPQAAILTRITRGALIDTLSEDYVRTARAKGLSQDAALRRHALRNASIPVLTILGLQLSFLLAGGVIIENVFYLPGLGRLVFQAISQRDLIVVEGVVFVLAFATVLIAFLVDLAYAAVDPRLRKSAS